VNAYESGAKQFDRSYRILPGFCNAALGSEQKLARITSVRLKALSFSSYRVFLSYKHGISIL
jgi:hypothetical protein